MKSLGFWKFSPSQDQYRTSTNLLTSTWAKIRLRHSGMIELLEFLGRPWGEQMVCHVFQSSVSYFPKTWRNRNRRGLCYHICRTRACCAVGLSQAHLRKYEVDLYFAGHAHRHRANLLSSLIPASAGWMCLEACHMIIWIISEYICTYRYIFI